MEKLTGIYQIQSKIKPYRVYIGSAVNINNRWSKHLGLLRNNKHPNLILQRHYNKYGEIDLQFSVLIGCDKEDLIKTEQYFIDSYSPYFNICPIAGSRQGTVRTEESKQLIRDIIKSKGNKMSDSNKQKLKEANTGRVISEETRTKLRNAKLGRIISDEQKLKQSLIMKGKGKGRKLSDETKHKLSIAHKGKPHLYARGVKQTKEHRDKIRIKVCKPIIQYDKQMNYIKEYASAGDASKELGISSSCICSCAMGDRKKGYTHGYIFKYKKGNGYRKVS